MTKIQLRHDTAANFASENPILLAGEAAIETDTNKMKIGDGTTAYNSLDYFGGDIDLSNYYNKSETNGLLDKKENSFNAESPLTKIVEVKPNSHLMTVTDNFAKSSNNYNCNFTVSEYGFGDSLQNSFRRAELAYVDIPYKFGQVVKMPSLRHDGTFQGGVTGGWAGYLDDNNNFMPVLYIRNYEPSSSHVMPQAYINLDFTEGFWSGYRRFQNTSNMGYGVTYSKDSSPSEGEFLFQLNQGANNYSLYTESNTNVSGTSKIYNSYISYNNTDANATTELSKINMIRYFPFYMGGTQALSTGNTFAISTSNNNYSYDTTKFAIYDVNDTLNNIPISSLVGGNFDVTGNTVTNYLALNISTGLAVQNGNLVNTNPTPYTAKNGINIANNEISILTGAGLSFSNIAQLPNTYLSSSSDITASSQENGQYAFQAFDGNDGTYWGLTSQPSSSNHAWIQRHHDAIRVTSVRILFTSEIIRDIYIKGSNDGVNFTQIGEFINNTNTDKTITCNPSQTYTYTRIEYGQPYSGWGQTKEIQINYETSSSVLVNTNPTPVIVDQTYDATSTNAQSGTAVAEAVEDKVDNSELVDITELYPTLGGLDKPGSAYIDLTFTPGASYTAPANGYFVVCRTGNTGEYFNMYNQSAGTATNQARVATGFNAPSNGQYRFWVPVAKGDRIYIGTNFSGSNATYDYFGFIYDKGSESEAS